MIKNILITGMPGSGKSTVLNKIIERYDKKIGFITKETRENGQRTGFEIETHNGKKARLADINFNTKYKVSKYFVDIDNLDKILGEDFHFNKYDLLYIDEIGQMELFSDKFKKLVKMFLDSDNVFIGTISKVYDDRFTKEIKQRKDIYVVEIDEKNREEKTEFIEVLLRKIEKAKNYVKEKYRFKIEDNEVEMKSVHDTRKIVLDRGEWKCSCDFFKKNKICSHVIALKEIMKI